MFAFITALLTGGSVTAVQKIAEKYIASDPDNPESRSLLIKTLDPNGNMRRQLSSFASFAYGFYLFMTVVLIFMSVWAVGGEQCTVTMGVKSCLANADVAAGRMTELFLPITSSWALIVSASFGVNTMNSYKGK